MKKVAVISTIFSLIVVFAAHAQDKKTIIENRCKEMVRVIGLSEKDQWRKFVKENYTEELINRKMRVEVQGGPPDGGAKTNTNADNEVNLEAKVGLYQRLHDDIGKGTITSLKIDGNNADVQVKGETGFNLSFALKFTPDAPHLMDGFMVQAMMGGPGN